MKKTYSDVCLKLYSTRLLDLLLEIQQYKMSSTKKTKQPLKLKKYVFPKKLQTARTTDEELHSVLREFWE